MVEMLKKLKILSKFSNLTPKRPTPSPNCSAVKPKRYQPRSNGGPCLPPERPQDSRVSAPNFADVLFTSMLVIMHRRCNECYSKESSPTKNGKSSDIFIGRHLGRK